MRAFKDEDLFVAFIGGSALGGAMTSSLWIALVIGLALTLLVAVLS